ncbi:CocE/NonD family hydrolase [Kitasatospora indigofera]|uniref:CocE/NonD family hydrolase n=1 Tax=Kitasatospora indigofera TaxID=67307 RepID=UPI0036BAD31A
MASPTRLLRVAAACALMALLTVTNASPVAAQAPVRLLVNNETQPIYGMSDAIYLTVNITVPDADGHIVDTDRDGKADTVQLRLKRPNTPAGTKIPTIIEPSPYNKYHTPSLPLHENVFAVDGTPAGTQVIEDPMVVQPPADADFGEPRSSKADLTDMTWESWFDNYFVPRGYAVADLDALGSGGSTGCPLPGSRAEQAGVKAAVDWLNGRAVAVDATTDLPVTASGWSSGNVGLKGKSYNGALSIAGAASGVAGLKTVVSVAGIADWYLYPRSNGATVAEDGVGGTGYDIDNLAADNNTGPNHKACNAIIASDVTAKLDRPSGDRNGFWDERNYAADTNKVTASVFIIQGMLDETVRPEAMISYWRALQGAGVPSKLWTFQGGHMRPYQLRRDEYVRQMHRWYDYWLYDQKLNGIMAEPKVDVQQQDLSTWTTQSSWPAPGTTDVQLKLHASGSLTTGSAPSAAQSMTDKGDTVATERVMDANGASNADSLAYITPKLSQPVTLQGIPSFTVNASLQGTTPFLTALLVDYGFEAKGWSGYWAYTGSTSGRNTLCDGISAGTNDGCADPYTTTFTRSAIHPTFRVISRGWADARNQSSLYNSNVVTDGVPFTIKWNGQPTEYTVAAGHRLGVVLVASDHGYNNPRFVGTSGSETTKLTVLTELSSVTLPVKAGTEAFGVRRISK